MEVEETSIEKGYFFNQKQQSGFARVAVLGYTTAQELFKDANPLSEKIRIKGRTFKVIGVLKERGNTFFGNVDNQVFMPVTTVQKDLLGINYVNLIRAKAVESSEMEIAKTEVEELLRYRHNIKSAKKDDFSVQSMGQMLSVLEEITGAIQAFLILVVAISLLVGGIGIMNIMLTTLSQRIREVGLRKALGAKDRDIFIQFLAESSLLTLIGGLLGVISGVGLGIIIAYLIRLFTDFDWYFLITSGQIVLAIGVALIIGVVFGLYPAQKAAKLNPIKALRYE
jgi:putative ABC transport system permease protein